MNVAYLAILFTFLTLHKYTHNADDKPLVQIILTQTQIARLTQIPPLAVETHGNTILQHYAHPNRHFVVKMDLGLPTYYQLSNDADVEKALYKLQSLKPWSFGWFYYDQKKSCTIS